MPSSDSHAPLARLLAILCLSAAVAWCQEWSGSITITAPSTGKPLSLRAWIPDIGKPVRAAMVLGWAFDDRDWRAVAAEYNCLMVATTLNYYDAQTDAQKVVAILKQASVQFPAHPEIAHTAVILNGWSQQSCGALCTASQPELANRVVAVVAIHEIDGAPWQAPLSVPHLFISAWPDGFSRLLGGKNALTLDRARHGAPITMVANVGHDHVDVFENYAFTRVWLEEVLARRLPAVAPATADAVMPNWANDPEAWLGAYDVVENTGTEPWGKGQRLTNVVIAARPAYADRRQPIWFPSQRCAQVWQVYSNTGIMPVHGTLALPKLVAPTISVQPTNVSVLPGKPFGFAAVVSGTPDPIYRWWREKGAAKAMLSSAAFCQGPSDPNSDADAGATFHLVASNCAGSVSSVSVTLSTAATAAPPWIRGQPQARTVAVGETATFAVETYAIPAPTFQWRRNEVDIPGAQAATYTTPATTAQDEGARYSVVVANRAGGIASSPAILTLLAPVAPAITSQPQRAQVYAGQAATFRVEAGGCPALAYQWTRNGVDIPGASVADYTTPPTVGEDAGASFAVRVSNLAGSVTSAAATLGVGTDVVPVRITSQPQPQTVTNPTMSAPGQSATFAVVATGTPAPTYQWIRNTPDAADLVIPGATAATYTTPATLGADNGAIYRVVVANPAGNVYSAAVRLTVNVPAAITSQPAGTTVQDGKVAKFRVGVTGWPSPRFQWRKNGVDIPSVKNDANWDNYTTPPTTAADDGAIYTVVVGNGIGGSVTSEPARLQVVTAKPDSSLTAEFFPLDSEPQDFPGIPAERKPTVTRLVPMVDDAGGFADTGLSVNFYVRWTGKLRVPTDGTYTFFTASDDGSRLLIDGRVVVDNGGQHAMTEKSGTVDLKAGEHPLELELFQAGGGVGCTLSWQGPGLGKAIIPASALMAR